MDYKRVLDRECPGCKSYRPGRQSDCEIRKIMYYEIGSSEPMKQWAEGQIFSGACKQRRKK